MVTASLAAEAAAPAAEELRPLFYLDPAITYLNHGSFGATPRPVMEESFRWQLEMEREPVHFVDGLLNRALDDARERLAPLVGAPADDLVFVTNATIGLNIVIRSLDLQPGDEILTTDHEYGALMLTWDHYCQRAGARVVQQTLPLPLTNAEEIVDALFAGVTERTKVIFFSHITSPTALTLPAELICARARELRIMTIIDGAHVVGQRELDLTAMGCDVYSSNCHKWLMTPKGSAFLYVRPEHHEWVEATTVSWGWAEGWGMKEAERAYGTFIRRNQWSGTRDCSPFLATPAAIDFQEQYHWDAVRARCHRLASETQRRLLALSGDRFQPLTADSPEWYRQLVAVPFPSDDAPAVKRRLLDEFRIQIPVHRHVSQPEGVALVRVSVQGYTTQDDLDRLVDAMGTIIGA
ncbi:MAG TPA: aminotransferase class V-fold PLP-dependent enzyme [Thermomicrobiales bacterium]|jgi:isopenicillin-N epimerase|nr:aminotransferase class V-fold PLP-dependent enzyme [Thermomicrobiales bacterium]